MPHWIYWTLGIAAADVLILVWNHGAHRKPNPDEFRRIRALSWKDQ